MKNEQMLELRYETDMPVGDQIDCYLSCNVRINKGEKKKKITRHGQENLVFSLLVAFL